MFDQEYAVVFGTNSRRMRFAAYQIALCLANGLQLPRAYQDGADDKIRLQIN